MQRTIRWAATAAAISAVLALAWTWLLRPRPIPVDLARVERGLVEDVVTNSQAGTVKSRDRARLGVERAGRIADIHVLEGARVRRGAALVTLDSSTERMQRELAERDLDAARAARVAADAAATLAQREYDRTAKLRSTNAVAEDALDRATSALDAARAETKAAAARVARAESAVRLARDELEHLVVTAPFDGVIARRLAEPGEAVVPGQPVLEMIASGRLYVTAPIDEMDIGKLREGQHARVTLDPYPGYVWNGVVTRLASVVNDVKEQNRTLDVEVDLAANPELPLPRPGTSADIEIVLARRESTLRVPSVAILEGHRVLEFTRDRAAAREVVVGLRNWQWTEIRAGLDEGDAVVTSLDQKGVREGARVVAKPAPPGGATAERR